MALIVEDGSGKPDADSYVSLQEFNDYCVRLGHSEDSAVSGASDTRKEAMLRRGTIYIDGLYGIRIRGRRKNPEQSLVFPQVKARYLDGRPIDPDSIPQPYKDAQCEAAVLELQGTTLVLTTMGQPQLKRKKTDVLEKEWFEAKESDWPTFGWIDAILASMFDPLPRDIHIVQIQRS